MRTPVAAGNWKMNLTPDAAEALARAVHDAAPGLPGVEIVLCPPAVYLASVARVVSNGPVALGGQNLYWEAEGAFTGEISGHMLRWVGCRYCIVGHSERRHVLKETDDEVNRKVRAAQRHSLVPIFCVGETRQHRESGQMEEVITTQVRRGLDGFAPRASGDLVIAYEPVWAIGTGLTATPQQADTVHRLVRGLIRQLWGDALAAGIRILYGGSVKPDNIEGLVAQPDIDGVLVGGASLKAEAFLAIARGCRLRSCS
ncbi:MAG: triose-phosphate isomerase [Planctomycetes bacterium]|nr:triose-phosphate isomerase [Planctomycetota bacterium]